VLDAGEWISVLDAGGDRGQGVEICELTGLVDDAGYPAGTRFIVRREDPHPDASAAR
jgi:hypothetical protein